MENKKTNQHPSQTVPTTIEPLIWAKFCYEGFSWRLMLYNCYDLVELNLNLKPKLPCIELRSKSKDLNLMI